MKPLSMSFSATSSVYSRIGYETVLNKGQHSMRRANGGAGRLRGAHRLRGLCACPMGSCACRRSAIMTHMSASAASCMPGPDL